MTVPPRKIIWETPPSDLAESPNYAFFYEELRQRPFKWARYPGSQAGASNWCLSHADYEYISSKVSGERRIWMRHIPEDAS